MDLQIKIEVGSEAREIVAGLRQFPDTIKTGVARAMDYQNALTVPHIQANYLRFSKTQPPVKIGCRFITGRLFGSLRRSDAVIKGNTISSSIGSNVEYAAAQEFGADYPARKIYPKPGNKALKFQIGDRVIFAKSVNLPAHRLEGRHFVERGIADRAPQYSNAVSKAIVDAWNQK